MNKIINFIKNNKLFFIIVISLVILDQLTKVIALNLLKDKTEIEIIKNFFGFVLVYNDGAAWNMLSGQRIWLSLISLVASIAISVFYFKSNKSLKTFTNVGLLMVISGSIGNMIDRMVSGKVIDFINVNIFILFNDQFPIFNIADLCVTFGAGVYLIGTLFLEKDTNGK